MTLFTVSVTSGNDTLAPNSSMDIDGFGFTRTVTSAAYSVPLNLVITPANQNGSALVTVSVDENQGVPGYGTSSCSQLILYQLSASGEKHSSGDKGQLQGRPEP
ncbi:MAG: hypothetical protein R2941_10085 [Desulfobacterales bacterium]